MDELEKLKKHREAVKKYQDKCDRINVIFPPGTRKCMEDLGIKQPSTFIKEVVAAELQRMKKYLK